MGIVAQDVQRLDRLITDIARASRIEAETAALISMRSISARMLFELTRAYASAPDEPRHVDDRVQPAPSPKGSVVLGQAAPLGQVFRNLIDNARSFSPRWRTGAASPPR